MSTRGVPHGAMLPASRASTASVAIPSRGLAGVRPSSVTRCGKENQRRGGRPGDCVGAIGARSFARRTSTASRTAQKRDGRLEGGPRPEIAAATTVVETTAYCAARAESATSGSARCASCRTSRPSNKRSNGGFASRSRRARNRIRKTARTMRVGRPMEVATAPAAAATPGATRCARQRRPAPARAHRRPETPRQPGGAEDADDSPTRESAAERRPSNTTRADISPHPLQEPAATNRLVLEITSAYAVSSATTTSP